MTNIGLGELLTIIIALSAYLATIRLIGIERLGKPGSEVSPDVKKKLKRKLLFLMFVDAPLVVSGLLLVYHIFAPDLFGCVAPACILRTAQGLFALAVVILAVLHAIEWGKTIRANV